MTSPGVGELAEARFARYLRERGYTFEVEPEFGTGRHPDYLVSANEYTIVAEVKAFETYGMFENSVPGQLMARSLEDALAPIRNKIKQAAGQLRGLQGRGWPLVVVLDNPGGRPIPIDSPYMIISAMYGDLTLRTSLEAEGASVSFERSQAATEDYGTTIRTSAQSRSYDGKSTLRPGLTSGSKNIAQTSSAVTAMTAVRR